MLFSGSINNSKDSSAFILPMLSRNLGDGVAHIKHSKPLSSSQIDLLPLLQVTHDIVNTPRLKLVPSRIIRQDALIVLHPDAFLDVFGALLIVFVRVPLGVMFPNPLGQARRRFARINFDLSPVGFL